MIRWPEARPIGRALLDAVGRPYPQAATEPPLPRFVDVLIHGLRHLALLSDPDGPCYDSAAASALGETWWGHLAALRPALAGMYSVEHGIV